VTKNKNRTYENSSCACEIYNLNTYLKEQDGNEWCQQTSQEVITTNLTENIQEREIIKTKSQWTRKQKVYEINWQIQNSLKG
jgi:hypothetical protein